MKTIKTSEDYQKFVQDKQPKQTLLKNCINAFLWGGFICVIGEVIMDVYILFGLEKDAASSFQSVTLIFIGSLLTSIGVYEKIGKKAGAGSMIPITGFANSVVAPAIEFKKEGYILGVGAKIFTLAGPVLIYSIISSIIVGLLYYVFRW